MHLRAVSSVPYAAAVALPPPVDQGQTSSCTGNASAMAFCEAMTNVANLPAGQWVELPSRLALYYAARALRGSAANDDGAYLSDVFEGARLIGVGPESAWSFSDDIAKVTSQPDWGYMRRAADQRVTTGAWRITSSGSQRLQDVKAAIATGSTVVWGSRLDEAFLDLPSGSVWPGVRGSVIGGHAMVLFKYEGDVFWSRSSWGDWCEGGSARVAAAAVASPDASDFWVVAMAKDYSRAA
jgi:hypothetical protein